MTTATTRRALSLLPLAALPTARGAMAQPATPQPPPPPVPSPEDTAPARLLRVVPMPADPARLLTAMPVFSFARLDLLATGRSEWAKVPGATRAAPVLTAAPLAVEESRLLAGGAAGAARWPDLVGFDFDAVDAVLVAGVTAGAVPPGALRVLAGADRLTDAEAVGRALERRGFARHAADDGTPLFELGATDDGVDLLHRARGGGDPFGAGVGLAQRIAVLPPAVVLVSSSGAVLRDAIRTGAARGPSLAGAEPVRALVAGLAGPFEVAQLVALPPLAQVSDPARVLLGAPGVADAPPPFGWEAAPMPPWIMAGLAELATPPGAPRRHRVVLVGPDPDGASAALGDRIARAEAGADPYGVASVEAAAAARVAAGSDRFGGLGVAALDLLLRPEARRERTPLYRWWSDVLRRVPVPLTIGAVRREAR